ncbi:MAG: cytochrome c oxidase accessory protein CcoG [Bacteroidales bacterium]
MNATEENKESFRDTINTVNYEGKRIWVHARKPSGKFYKYRKIVAFVLIVFLFLAPFLKFKGEQLVLINVLERKFVFFGFIFWPQDFYFFYLIMLALFVFIILFTVVYGRLFCGWACPQTIFMEFVFRKIEWWIDGNPTAQKKLKEQKLNYTKFWKRALKHSIFWGISFIISNTFLAYLIGSDELLKIINEPVSNHLVGFISIVIFASVFYFIFAWFREQVCIIMCPYGRLQGVLLDSNSIIVAYDYKRGEPRGAARKKEIEAGVVKGDCIDCKLCVQVCPTAIDIRNGSQMECINCTACIDACNSVMKKVKKPLGLIRYASQNGIEKGQKFKLTTRNVAYTVFLILIMAVTTSFFMKRGDIETVILRTPGMEFQEQPNEEISNLYNFKIVNKSNHNIDLEIKLLEPNGHIVVSGETFLKYSDKTEGVIVVFLKKQDIKQAKTKIKFGIYHQGELLEQYTSSFSYK